MRNRRKVILGVALSFMILFTCVGYAALNDTLSISGSMSATAPKEIFFSEISSAPVDGSGVTASISGLREITVSNTTSETVKATFAITVMNNSGARQVFTGYSREYVTENSILLEEDNTQKIIVAPVTKDDSNPYYSGANGLSWEIGEYITLYVTISLPANTENVTISYEFAQFIYTITYINNGETLDVRYVYDNDNPVSTENATAAKAAVSDMAEQGYNVEFGYWMNAGSTQKDTIDAGNADDVVLYPKFGTLYTAMFVDYDGNVIDWTFFTADENGFKTVTDMADAIKNANKIPALEDLEFEYWEVHETDEHGNTIAEYLLDDLSNSFGKTDVGATDISIYPSYKFNGDVRLESVDIDGDGKTDEWEVIGYKIETGSTIVRIPSVVKGKNVTTISADAFSSYDDLHSALIPGTIKRINAQAFSANNGTGRDTVTLYYAGDPDTWNKAMTLYNERGDNYDEDDSAMLALNWDNYMGDGSRVFFLDGNCKVDLSKGYWELANDGNIFSPHYVWLFHSHTFPYDSTQHSCSHEHNQNDTDYDGKCDCTSTTTGDTAHIYVDEEGNIMGRNDEGTPVNSDGTVIYLKEESNWFTTTYTLTDGTNTYYRYRPDAQYWTTTTTTSEEEETP